MKKLGIAIVMTVLAAILAGGDFLAAQYLSDAASLSGLWV